MSAAKLIPFAGKDKTERPYGGRHITDPYGGGADYLLSQWLQLQ